MKPMPGSCTGCAGKWAGRFPCFYESGVQWKGWGMCA